MTYPKKIMSLTELSRLGFPMSMLREMCKSIDAYRFVSRTSEKKTAKLLVDTEEFEKVRTERIRTRSYEVRGGGER